MDAYFSPEGLVMFEGKVASMQGGADIVSQKNIDTLAYGGGDQIFIPGARHKFEAMGVKPEKIGWANDPVFLELQRKRKSVRSAM